MRKRALTDAQDIHAPIGLALNLHDVRCRADLVWLGCIAHFFARSDQHHPKGLPVLNAFADHLAIARLKDMQWQQTVRERARYSAEKAAASPCRHCT